MKSLSSVSAALVDVVARTELTTGDEQVALMVGESLALTSSTDDASSAGVDVVHVCVSGWEPVRLALVGQCLR